MTTLIHDLEQKRGDREIIQDSAENLKIIEKQISGVQDSPTNEKEYRKPEIVVYKYSNKAKKQLHESIFISGKPYFVKKFFDGKRNEYSITMVPCVEEDTRNLWPPYEEECPYIPYEFTTIEEAREYWARAENTTVDSLFEIIKTIAKKYNEVDEKTITLLCANTFGSYFQDRLSTIDTLIVVGGNGTGKSVFGETYECLGYRVVNVTNTTEAFWYRIFGTVEPGQVTIVAEEVDKLDENSRIMDMLKVGYQPASRVYRMSKDGKKMDSYYPYCFKILIAERSPKEDKARGLLDRSFRVNSYKGHPEEKIKEIRNPQGNTKRQKLLDEIMDLRKLMLMYRLIHYNDPLKEVDVGLDGRDEELCKPLLQLFYTLGASRVILEEIEETLQYFLNIKNEMKKDSFEVLYYPVIINAISQCGNIISTGRIWKSIIESLGGEPSEKNTKLFYSSDYGPLYRNTVIREVLDKFGGKIKHRKTGNEIIFNLEHVRQMEKLFNVTNVIHTKLIGDPGDAGDSVAGEN